MRETLINERIIICMYTQEPCHHRFSTRAELAQSTIRSFSRSFNVGSTMTSALAKWSCSFCTTNFLTLLYQRRLSLSDGPKCPHPASSKSPLHELWENHLRDKMRRPWGKECPSDQIKQTWQLGIVGLNLIESPTLQTILNQNHLNTETGKEKIQSTIITHHRHVGLLATLAQTS